MNQEIFSSHLGKQICEAVDCNENATTEIQVKVGQKSSIILFVCEKCMNKFSHVQTDKKKNKQQLPSVMCETAHNLLYKEKTGTEGDQTNRPARDYASNGNAYNEDYTFSD